VSYNLFMGPHQLKCIYIALYLFHQGINKDEHLINR